MIVTFGMSFDSGVWPGPLGGRDHAAGEPWLGPLGLLGLLETQLGLIRPPSSAAMRAAALVPALRADAGFWTESVEIDPLATARTLLGWRETLRLHGWSGARVGAPRIDRLADVTRSVEPGPADRLALVIDALREQPVDIARVRLLGDDLADLPRLWRDALAALEARGADIEVIPPTSPTPPTALPAALATDGTTDLAACLRPDFEPRGDGSLQLLRPAGPLAAADQVAAWLAARDSSAGAVVIGGDAVLDGALRRHGLPTLGAPAATGQHVLLQLLPLVLELAWAPQDPQAALELLIAPASPVPPSIAWRLADALRDWPAVDSDVWRTALAMGLAAMEPEKRRAAVAARLDILLGAPAGGETIDATEVRRRAGALRAWLQTRLAVSASEGGGEGEGEGERGRGRDRGRDRDREADAGRWAAAVVQCSDLLALLDATGDSSLTRPHLRRLVAAATADAPLEPRHPAEAGLARVAHPASIVGRAPCVVWWQFTRDAAETVRPLPLDAAEIGALAAAGVRLPEPARLAEEIGARWRRPFQLATEHLLLVCPQVGRDGRDTHLNPPHPVFDEISARLDDAALARLCATEPKGALRSRRLTLLPAPRPQTAWRTTRDVLAGAGGRISPTSAGDLVACPLHWVLKRIARLERGRTEPLPAGALLAGNLTHHIIERVLERVRKGETLTGEDAAVAAAEIFDREGPRLATVLFVRGAEADRHEMRDVVAEAARELVEHLRQSGAAIEGIEQWIEGVRLGPFELFGRYDLRLRGPDAIVDLKWGRAKDRREELERGAAHQLAAYARLAAGTGPLPPAAYFITRSQRLLATAGAPFPHAEVPDGPPLDATWRGLERAIADRCAELAAGTVAAPCVSEDEDAQPRRDELSDGRLVLAPPCAYCDYTRICRGEACPSLS